MSEIKCENCGAPFDVQVVLGVSVTPEELNQMRNPYEAIASAKVTGIMAGATVSAAPQSGKLSERLQQFAFYMTEQQKDPADAMLVWDLHDAAKALRGQGL